MENLIKNNNIKKNIKLINKYNMFKNKEHIINLYVKKYLNSKRKNTSKTKERSEIKGSTRKIQKQKGTGNARKGDIKNPIFRGGGRIFGPKNNRNYKKKINKKVYKIVKKILLCNKIINKKVFILNKIKFYSHKTKYFINYFKKFKIKINNKIKYLIITDKIYKKLLIASKNIKNVKINNIKQINIYNILISDYIIFINKKINNIINIIKQ
ncbi:50S ribosomal protein L4 [Candidatus Shikimatogenerans bostrichidophilus]|uniref:50S ribosomal protein L4 n=1 Tax=Candidatus Shikimatogenerans bostrichidophilus TaxID=2943807 RepID=UPI002965E92C